MHSWKPPFLKEWFEFSKFSQKGGIQIFHKKGRVAEIGWHPITYFHANLPFPILSFSEWVVMFFLLIYTISLSILCVSWEELSLIPDFGVSTAILDTTDIFRRWCKLNFGPLRSHVKSRDFPERIDGRRQLFLLFYESFLE